MLIRFFRRLIFEQKSSKMNKFTLLVERPALFLGHGEGKVSH